MYETQRTRYNILRSICTSTYNSTRVDEERTCRILLAIKMKTRTVVGRGEEGPPYDPGSELLLGRREGESSARIAKGMQEKNKKICRHKPVGHRIALRTHDNKNTPSGTRLPVITLSTTSNEGGTYNENGRLESISWGSVHRRIARCFTLPGAGARKSPQKLLQRHVIFFVVYGKSQARQK